MHTSVTRPRIVSGSMRGRLPASGSPLGLPLVTSNRNAKSCRFVGSQYTEVATVVMMITPLHLLLSLQKGCQCCYEYWPIQHYQFFPVAGIDTSLSGKRN